MSVVGQRYLVAIIWAVGAHVIAAVALELADVEAKVDYSEDETEVALEEPPPPIPKFIEPEPEPEPEPQPEPVIDRPKVVDKVEPKITSRVRLTDPVVPTTDEPVEGEPSPVAPGGVYQMDDIAPAGTMKVGKGNAKRDGPSGPGVGTGGGGTAKKGPPKPVSIASIKRRAMPIGDTDYANIGKSYPPEALKRRIEGDVVIKLIVDDKGTVISRSLVKGLGFGLNKRALALARKLRFKAAIDTNDRPVTSVVVWTFTFALPD